MVNTMMRVNKNASNKSSQTTESGRTHNDDIASQADLYKNGADAVLEISTGDSFLSAEAFGLAAFKWSPENDKIIFGGDWHTILKDQLPASSDFKSLLDLLHSEDYGPVYLAFSDLSHGRIYHLEYEARVSSSDPNHPNWVLIRAHSVRNAQGEVLEIHGALMDITKYKTTVEDDSDFQHKDLTTGLANRQKLLSQIEACQISPDKSAASRKMDVIILDLDRFRVVNESLGEAAGDQVLRIVGERLRRQLRRGDMIARLGGDQYAFVLLSKTQTIQKEDNLTRRLDKLRTIVGNPIHLSEKYSSGEPVILDINIGLRRSSTTENISAEHLIRDASIALREAKNAKSQHIVEFEDEMHEKMLVSVQYEKIIRQALKENWVEVHYQPVIESSTGELTGFEALARINHPKQGIIPPGIFIPVAEETGLIAELTRRVIYKSMSQLAKWRNDHTSLSEVTMAINLSPALFEDETILADLEAGLMQSNIEGRHIKIEITESLLIKSMAEAVQILDAIKQMGIQICIDDFGTGYSSLSYIRNFAFDTLKIDRSFIQHITNEPRDAELVRSIVQMGQNVGMNIVVEGVEEIEQHELLANLGCHYMQGYLVARPLPADQASDWIKGHQIN